MIATTRQRVIDILHTHIRPLLLNAPNARVAPAVPQGVNTFDLPAFMVMSNGSTRQVMSNATWRVTTNWLITVLGFEVMTGNTIQNEARMHEWLDVVYNGWRGHQRLQLNNIPLAGIVQGDLIGDGGVQVLSFPTASIDKQYVGVQMTLQTIYTQPC